MVFAVLLHGRKGKRAVQLWMDNRSDIGGAEAKPGLESLPQHKHCSKDLQPAAVLRSSSKAPQRLTRHCWVGGMQHEGCVSTHVVP